MKLSAKQKEVIQKMREGWVLEYNGFNDILSNGSRRITLRYMTYRKLRNLFLIGMDNTLTELGKSITL